MKNRLSFGTVALLGASLLAGSGFFSACVPAATNSEPPNALVASPRAISLTNTTTTGASTLALNCGCRYKLTVTGFSGDTSDIHYAALEPLDSMTSQHHIQVNASPTAASGTHTATLSFYAPDDNGLNFYDTVRVSLVVP